MLTNLQEIRLVFVLGLAIFVLSNATVVFAAATEKQRPPQRRKPAATRKQQKALTGPRKQGEEDPDIAGIRPGPQPLPPQWELVQE